MGVNYRRPLDFTCYKRRARVRIYGGTFPAKFPSSNKCEFCPKVSNKEGNKTLTCNRLHQRSKKNRKNFSLQHFHDPQEKWGSQTCDQFEGLESISGLPSFQDGKLSNRKGLDARRGLDDKTGFERRLSFSSRDTRSSEIPCLPLGWQMLCLLCSSLWAGSSPTGVYKITESILVDIRQNMVIRCVMYSDDLLSFGRTKTDCLQKAKKIMTLLQELSFTINIKKSNRVHSTDRVSEPNPGLKPDESVSPRTKGFRPDRIMPSILSMTSLAARSLASLQEKMTSCLYVVLPASTF